MMTARTCPFVPMGLPLVFALLAGEQENEGMSQSYNAMKTLLTSQAPKGLRWTIERARAADHQQTPILALPSALYEFFAGDRSNLSATQSNRTARLTSRRANQN